MLTIIAGFNLYISELTKSAKFGFIPPLNRFFESIVDVHSSEHSSNASRTFSFKLYLSKI